MRHASQSDEAPPTSCSEVFQAGSCDLDTPGPSALARSSSASDIMEPFIVERVKGEEAQRDPVSFPNPHHHQHPSTTTANSHTAQPLSQPLTSPSPKPFTSYNGVSLSSNAQSDDSVYGQPWLQTGSQSLGSGSDWVSRWDSAFAFSSEKELDADEGETGAEVEEDDLFSSIRDYLSQRGADRKEEAREGDESESIATEPALVQTGIARLQLAYAGQLEEGRRVKSEGRQVSKSVRHSSVDSTEESEAEQRSIYECLELQCQWPSPSVKGSFNLERNSDENKGVGTKTGSEGKFDMWTELEETKPEEKEGEMNTRPSLIRQESTTAEPNSESASQTSDAAKAKISSSSTKRLSSGSNLHVSFRPSTESVQFHNPLESKEAHWKARLRRLSHFHTHSHSAGERLSRSGSGGKLAAEGAGKFSSRTGAGHKAGSQERFLPSSAAESSGVVATDAGSPESRPGTAGDRVHPGSFTRSNLGPETSSEVLSSGSGSSGVSAGVRGRLGRSTLRYRVSRSRSQEPGSTASRHHQGALLGGVYKSVVHALSSKPRPRGQGSSQGSSPQRQSRAAMGDASLRDLYSHVLGYFGRKTTTPGEACGEPSAHRGHICGKKYSPMHKHQQLFFLFG